MCGDDDGEDDVEEKNGDKETHAVVERYLALLKLDIKLHAEVLAQLNLPGRPGIDPATLEADRGEDEGKRHDGHGSLIAEGLAVSVGYLVGGALPLLPFCFVRDVNTGLAVSFTVCVAALFLFGLGKSYILINDGESRTGAQARWARVRSSLREGLEMTFYLGALLPVSRCCVHLC